MAGWCPKPRCRASDFSIWYSNDGQCKKAPGWGRKRTENSTRQDHRRPADGATGRPGHRDGIRADRDTGRPGRYTGMVHRMVSGHWKTERNLLTTAGYCSVLAKPGRLKKKYNGVFRMDDIIYLNLCNQENTMFHSVLFIQSELYILGLCRNGRPALRPV